MWTNTDYIGSNIFANLEKYYDCLLPPPKEKIWRADTPSSAGQKLLFCIEYCITASKGEETTITKALHPISKPAPPQHTFKMKHVKTNLLKIKFESSS